MSQPAQNENTGPIVIQFSGCEDSQTSADASNVIKFGLPNVEGPAVSGGACTTSFLKVMGLTKASKETITFGNLLREMRKLLKELKYSQNPQLSTSIPLDLAKQEFDLTLPETDLGKARTKALLIGINYHGHQTGVLSGCINDAQKMKRFLVKEGFSSSRMRFLHDGPDVPYGFRPTKENIITGLKWLVDGVKPGDSLFLHYSGHGTQVPDLNGDESDGMDEAMVPVDYKTTGIILDDDVYTMVVDALPAGVQLVAIFDCCHSGTILDLPHKFTVL